MRKFDPLYPAFAGLNTGGELELLLKIKIKKMIGKLRGRVELVKDTFAIIDVNGVGYKVMLNEIALGKIAKEQDQEISLFIHTNVKEDHIHLYGFMSLEELEMFELLLSVSGIGPKAGLAILTIASVATIKNAIFKEDYTLLTQVSGIGKKTAERVCLELRSKVEGVEGEDKQEVEASQEVIEALMAMGYSASEARESVQAIPDDVTDESEMIKLALRSIKK